MHSQSAESPLVIRRSAVAMAEQDFDDLLGELAKAADAIAADQIDAEQRCEARHAEMERLLGLCTEDSLRNPAEVLASLREDLAYDTLKRIRTAQREFVSWWADVANIALVSALLGSSADPVRVMAAAPSIGLLEEDVERLPPIDQDHRDLMELNLHMAAGPLGAREGRSPDDLARDVQRFGLAVRGDHHGRAIIVEDSSPEAIRQRLWGAVWDRLKAPCLPDTAALVTALTERGVPDDATAAIRNASQRVNDALDAASRVADLRSRIAAGEFPEEDEWGSEEESNELQDEAAQLHARLADYARTITTHLAIIRDTCRKSAPHT